MQRYWPNSIREGGWSRNPIGARNVQVAMAPAHDIPISYKYQSKIAYIIY